MPVKNTKEARGFNLGCRQRTNGDMFILKRHTCIFSYMFVYIYVCVCIYIDVYIHTYIYISTCIYSFSFVFSQCIYDINAKMYHDTHASTYPLTSIATRLPCIELQA